MALTTCKCKRLTSLHFKGLTELSYNINTLAHLQICPQNKQTSM